MYGKCGPFVCMKYTSNGMFLWLHAMVAKGLHFNPPMYAKCDALLHLKSHFKEHTSLVDHHGDLSNSFRLTMDVKHDSLV